RGGRSSGTLSARSSSTSRPPPPRPEAHAGGAPGGAGRLSTPAAEWIAFLKGTELFRGLPEATLQSLVAGMTEVGLDADTALFRQGERADAMYVLRDGRLMVLAEESDAPARALGMLESGQCVGEGALIMGGSRSATVRATMPCRLLRLSTEGFEKALADHPVLRQVLNGLVAA